MSFGLLVDNELPLPQLDDLKDDDLTLVPISLRLTTLCKLPRGKLDGLECFIGILQGSDDKPGYDVGGEILADVGLEFEAVLVRGFNNMVPPPFVLVLPPAIQK